MPFTLELRAVVQWWHDGDTFYGYVIQGFDSYRGTRDKPIRCRAAKIDAAELSTGVPGADATAAATALAPPGEYGCTSFKPDKYGRPVLDLHLPSGFLFSDAMLAGGWAKRYV